MRIYGVCNLRKLFSDKPHEKQYPDQIPNNEMLEIGKEQGCEGGLQTSHGRVKMQADVKRANSLRLTESLQLTDFL